MSETHQNACHNYKQGSFDLKGQEIQLTQKREKARDNETRTDNDAQFIDSLVGYRR